MYLMAQTVTAAHQAVGRDIVGRVSFIHYDNLRFLGGLDCSGMTMCAFANAGIFIPLPVLTPLICIFRLQSGDA